MTLKWVIGCGDGIGTVSGYRTEALMRSWKVSQGGAISAETKCIETRRFLVLVEVGLGETWEGFEINKLS